MPIKKIILYSLAALLIIFGIWGYKLIWGKPFNFNHLLERYLVEVALNEPELLTLAGIIDNTILDFHSNKLADASPGHSYKMMERDKEYLQLLRRYSRENLSGQKAISYDMAVWLLETNIEGEPWMFHDYPVNQTLGVQSLLPTFMTTHHQVVDKGSAENYIARLRAFEEKFGQVRESVLYRAERSIIPPQFVIDHVLTEMKGFIGQAAEENPLYVNLQTKLGELDNVSDGDKGVLLNDAASAIENEVSAGYQYLIDTFENLQGRADGQAGVWSLPDGDNYYRYLTRLHTTLPLTPQEVHETGLQEVARIKIEMFLLFDEIGISGETIAGRFSVLDNEYDMAYPDTSGVRDQIISDYAEIIDFLYEETSPHFQRTPQAGVEVRRVPEYSEATAPFAYYNIPAMDGSRPGIFFINLRDLDEITKYSMTSLAAHEAVPGHHFQLALAQEIENVPLIRNLYPFTSYVEGWALYAELLVHEIGIYEDDPYGNLGRLQFEMFRAVRLVVDTGIHAKQWSREQAIEYMHEHTGMPRGNIVSEIERYIVMPGQALAYKTGMMHILELRDKAETELGENFGLAEFHDVILMNGSLPMEILTDVVDTYIEENRR